MKCRVKEWCCSAFPLQEGGRILVYLCLGQLLLSVSINHVLLHIGHNRRMGLVLHRELSLTLSHTSKLTRVAKHVVQRNLGSQRELVVSNFGIDDGSFTLVESTNDVTLEFNGSDNLDGHERFKDHRLRLHECLSEGTDGGESESQFGRILNVGSTILQDESTTVDGVTSEHTTIERFSETLEKKESQIYLVKLAFGVCKGQTQKEELTFSIAGMYWFGTFPPMTLFSKATSLPVSLSTSIGSMLPLTRPN